MCPILKILIREIPFQPEMPSEKMMQLVGKIYENQKYVMVKIGTSELQKNCWKNMDTQDCVAGTFQNVNGGTMCILCPSGTYSAILAQADVNNCTKCLGGKYSVAIGATSDGVCLTCEAGTYTVPGSSRCTKCPLGKYGNSSSSAGLSAMYCLHCGKGKFSNYAQAVNNSACRECPAGLPFECCKGLKQNYKCMFFKHLQVRMHCALVRRVV